MKIRVIPVGIGSEKISKELFGGLKKYLSLSTTVYPAFSNTLLIALFPSHNSPMTVVSGENPNCRAIVIIAAVVRAAVSYSIILSQGSLLTDLGGRPFFRIPFGFFADPSFPNKIIYNKTKLVFGQNENELPSAVDSFSSEGGVRFLIFLSI